MSELKPCPFCGSKWAQVRYMGGKWQEPSAFESGYRGECCSCHAVTKAYVTEAEAAAAWNTRHVETCKVTSEHVDIDGERMTDYSCGCLNQSGWGHNFCPNCGAKVVGE